MVTNVIYLGINGTVIALDRATGKELWRTTLKGTEFVNVVLDNDRLYATTKGEIICLSVTTGEPLWHNKLSGMGWGLVSIATPSGSQVLSAQEKRRRDQSNDAAAVSAAS